MDAHWKSWPQEGCFTLEIGREPNETDAGPYSNLSRENNEIRLVEVLAGDPSEPIRCHVASFPLDDAPTYTALSYVWGRPDRDCKIELNGYCRASRKNLWRFLHQIRKLPEWRGTKFWIDALCIQQSDSQERNHQVGLMAEIYQMAAQVLVWLGQEYAHGGDAFRALRDANRWSSDVEKGWWMSQGAKGILQLCQRHYWTRLWVVQELALARKIMLLCGKELLPWETLLAPAPAVMTMTSGPAARMIAQIKTTQCSEPVFNKAHVVVSRVMTITRSAAARMIAQRQRERPRPRSYDSLFNRVLAFGFLACSEPRDKVFALLGIVDTGCENIVPDYTVDLSTLLNTVLRNEHHLLEPTSLLIVKLQCLRLAKATSVHPALILSPKKIPQSSRLEFAVFALRDDKSGLTFWWAASHKHEAVQRLWVSRNGEKPLYDALRRIVQLGETSLCRLLLRSWKFKIDGEGTAYFDKNHRHPLLEAAGGGFHDIAKLLLRLCTGKPSRTLLKETFEKYLDKGHAEEALDLLGTLLFHAPHSVDGLLSMLQAAVSHNNTRLIQRCFETARQSTFTRDDIDFLAHVVVRDAMDKDQPLVRASLDGLRALRKDAVDSNDRTEKILPENDEVALLSCSIESGLTRLSCQLIEESDVDVNSLYYCRLCHDGRVDGKTTMLERAIRYLNVPVVKALLSRQDLIVKANVVEVAMPRLELISANSIFDERMKEILEMLLRQYPKTHVSAEYRERGLRSAVQNNKPELVKLLLHPEDTKTDRRYGRFNVNRLDKLYDPILNLAVKQESEQLVKVLLGEPRLYVDAKTDRGMTALMQAVAQNNSGIVNLLLGRQDLNVNSETSHGMTALMQAVIQNNDGIVSLLLGRQDLNVNSETARGVTALMQAVTQNNAGIVSLLLGRQDLDVNSETACGVTALMQAVTQNNLGMIDLLLGRQDLDVTLRDRDGNTALAQAVQTGLKDLVEYLLLHKRIEPLWLDREDICLVQKSISEAPSQREEMMAPLKRYYIERASRQRVKVKKHFPGIYDAHILPQLEAQRRALDDAENIRCFWADSEMRNLA